MNASNLMRGNISWIIRQYCLRIVNHTPPFICIMGNSHTTEHLPSERDEQWDIVS